MGTTVKKHEIDMLHGSIWDKLPLFALPVAATAILEQLFLSLIHIYPSP